MTDEPRAPRLASGLHTILRLGLLLLAFASSGSASSFPPGYRFHTLQGQRIDLHYHDPLEAVARRALPLAEELLSTHEQRYGVLLGPRLQLVLVDAQDDPNGFATPLPYPIVQIRAAAPSPADDFGNYDNWLRLVLSHELAHAVHLEAARGLPALGRKLFGRAPFLFPNTFTPPWLIEGLATFEETRNTAFGRGRNPDSRAVLRLAALEGRFPSEDQATPGLDLWPGGQTPYLFGEGFLSAFTDQHGDHTLPRLSRSQSGKIVPWLDDLTARGVTGQSFHAAWGRWRQSQDQEAQAFAEQRRAWASAPASRPLTTAGVRQRSPRVSPDGQWIAYSSRTLDRDRQIRLLRPDGSQDHVVAVRNGGSGLSWTRDGQTLVYDEPEVRDLFTTRSDLRALDLATGRRRWLTRGLRAREPDLGPDSRVVFVRRFEDRSELSVLPLSGGEPVELTRSELETQWQGPRWSPEGHRIAVSRWRPGGIVELCLVDPTTGAVEVLVGDRARDLEPEWSPDGSALAFRSDRDGVSNLYVLKLADRSLWRMTDVLGIASQPSFFPDGARVAFTNYSSRGEDLEIVDWDPALARPADLFQDPFPESSPWPEPSAVPARPYRSWSALRPRFWTPWVEQDNSEWRVGALTGGTDPLFRQGWAALVRRGLETDRWSWQVVGLYDRWKPTFQLSLEDNSAAETQGVDRTRTARFSASWPLQRSLRSSQVLQLTWRRERQERLLESGGQRLVPESRLDLGGLELAWQRSSARRYPFSISAVEGGFWRLAILKDDPALGSGVDLVKVSAEARAYQSAFGRRDALALRVAGGTTFGEPGFRRSFAAGGFPDGSLFDLVRTNLVLLRGYSDDAFEGRSVLGASLEYRVRLGSPERGVRSLPVFLRHLHGTGFVDAAQAWSGSLDASRTKWGAGAALGADLFVGHAAPLTASLGLARGFDRLRGDTRAYFRMGLAF